MATRKTKAAKKKSAPAPVDPARAPRHRRPIDGPGVRVRMYDIGFGDCFLLFIPTIEGEKKVLIDCGAVKKHRKSVREIAARVIDDVRDEDGVPRIDVVVATHRHKDHIIGFDNPDWAEVHVEEVWMPWIEDPSDAEARRIHQAQHSLAMNLDRWLRSQPGFSEGGQLAMVAMNALSNDDAMNTLHNGFANAAKRRFLPGPKRKDQTLRTDALPGVTTYVLGPSRDEDVIRQMDPPKSASYLMLDHSDGEGPNALPRPFPESMAIKTPKAKHPHAANDLRRFLKTLGLGDDEALAASLDSSVNGTSLMLMFSVGRAHLLFPGDAQWGTWKSVLEDPEWSRLLEKTDFYKVGHHGSHNATPSEFVEKRAPDDFVGMIPVHWYSRWPEIPRSPLLEALGERTGNLAQADEDEPSRAFTRGPNNWWTETKIPIS